MNVAVVGTGLIGGSIGLAARERLGAHVRGFGPEAPRAVARGALDVACDDLASALEDAEIAFVATPLGVIGETIDAVLAAAPADCVVTDVGSTKRGVVAGRADERFVGGHPLAGAEATGVDHARADLFEDAVWYLTPGPTTGGVGLERLHRTLTAIGARPVAIDPEAHDRLMAAISHLPHVLANVLVEQATRAIAQGEAIPATGPSFRDATRVAGANPGIWPDILLANADTLVDQLDDVIASLTSARDALAAGDRTTITSWQRDAAALRRELLESGLAGGPRTELRVAVPNRPGVIADLALGLGRAGINISDMALAPSPDNTRGEVALWVAEADARRAAEIVRGLGFPLTVETTIR